MRCDEALGDYESVLVSSGDLLELLSADKPETANEQSPPDDPASSAFACEAKRLGAAAACALQRWDLLREATGSSSSAEAESSAEARM